MLKVWFGKAASVKLTQAEFMKRARVSAGNGMIAYLPSEGEYCWDTVQCLKCGLVKQRVSN